MNDLDDFEKRLRSQPFREAPGSLKQAVLEKARAAQPSADPGPRPDHAPSWLFQLRQLLWPHPAAWTALAALWVVILGLNVLSMEQVASPGSGTPLVTSDQMKLVLSQQRKLREELLGLDTVQQASPRSLDGTESSPQQPRSQLNAEWIAG